MSTAKRVLLVIGGGIAAYKCLELIRRLRDDGIAVRTVMTAAAQRFVTPLTVGALSNERVLTDLFDLDDEREIGHIRLSREADLVVVAPATANLMARMANGLADDLATAVMLASDKPILVAPAMNPRMWSHPATRRNVAQLIDDGVTFIGPHAGEMAERGEAGVGRMAEPDEIRAAIHRMLAEPAGRPLAGRHVLVTTGPTHEAIDPVRYLANRSSGKQGHAIAAAARDAGARVTLVSGPTGLSPLAGVATVAVESAREMLAAVEATLPADVAIFAAAVADWRVEGAAGQKLKKEAGGVPTLALVENPDILRTIASRRKRRPGLVVGFAAETEKVVAHARAKLARKGCDWIVANDVSVPSGGGGVMGGDENTVHIVTADGVEDWPKASKSEVARRLVARIALALEGAGAAHGGTGSGDANEGTEGGS
ncbi:MAG: bifunctional phosphopantothenoylcysteine decarboxylase/phosphopantothenate--cysteine ligase CoaBC [Rhizobiales bacterium]|nr:bifunctional phosphopantothenoylcysteine decarboxylase/phosphopantothenate--cysteine ligase CoaBC [Hyphomicrobiales bacterium]